MAAAVGGDLARRVAVALVGIPLVLALAYLGEHWLSGFLAMMAALGAWEFCRMHRARGDAAAPVLAGALAGALVIAAAGATMTGFVVFSTLACLAVGCAVLFAFPHTAEPGRAIIITLFGAAYTGVLLCFAVWLRELGGPPRDIAGAAVLLLPVVATWLNDTAAYFGGRAFGRHKLAPATSPGKTWEGAAAGFLAAALGAWLYLEATQALVPWTSEAWAVVALGGAVAVAGQVGDLFESRFKRDCGVKDSSNLIPGHGGVLDRMDSLLFVFPVAFAYFSAVGV